MKVHGMNLPGSQRPGVSLLNRLRSMEERFSARGPTVCYRLPRWPVDRIKILLEVEDHPEYNSAYTLAYRQ